MLPKSVLLTFVVMTCSLAKAQAPLAAQIAESRVVNDGKFTLGAKELPEAPISSTANPNAIVSTTVQVTAGDQSNAVDHNAPEAFHASAEDISASAGTYGDFSRYLQLFPGVVFNTDESNDILVRGGNPIENLYLVDGIEVPNINHIATEASTGGLVSMIDTSSLENVDLRTGGYDASYEERLSSVVDIRTLGAPKGPHTEMDAGFVGAGGLTDLPLSGSGSMLVSAHRSLLNLFTKDIGLNGVPIYTNALISVHRKLTSSDEISVLALGGVDSIDIQPASIDPAETNTIQTQYSGWRETSGVRWQHTFSNHNFGNMTLSDSEQHETIDQQDQYFNHSSGLSNPRNPVLTPVYSELTHDGTTNLRYDDYHDIGSKMTVIVGGALHSYRVDYDVAQPQGEQSPLSANPTHSDATSFAPNFMSLERGGYAEATLHITDRWSLSGGGRSESFQFGGHNAVTPRLSSTLLLSPHIGVHASFGEYAQMPPFVYLTSWPQNYGLEPIHARHIVAGFDVSDGKSNKMGLEIYQKNYHNYPVSTEYPTLSLANMVDTLGQQFLWIPLTSQGTGVTRGAELFGQAHLGSHFAGQANIAYARAEFAASDGILRPGNFDYPIVVNCAGTYRSGKRYEASWRYEYSTGRPYTPFVLSASAAQGRPIYELSQINALRGPAYSRLDGQVDRTFFLGSHRLIAYAGLENILNHQNLLGYYWLPRYGVKLCESNPEHCVEPQYQMSRFPNFGLRYAF